MKSDCSIGQRGEMGLPLIFNNLEVKHSLVNSKGIGIVFTFHYLPLIPIAFFSVCLRKFKVRYFTVMLCRGERVNYSALCVVLCFTD